LAGVRSWAAGVCDDNVAGLLVADRLAEHAADVVAPDVDPVDDATADRFELRCARAARRDHVVPSRVQLPDELEPDPAARSGHQPRGHGALVAQRLTSTA